MIEHEYKPCQIHQTARPVLICCRKQQQFSQMCDSLARLAPVTVSTLDLIQLSQFATLPVKCCNVKNVRA
ncbi:hypothetical protein J6590_012797 [Homalodisca vitripennis]|nr:hypothetical protein J6590_012797 [Homalodisca vitripennis]